MNINLMLYNIIAMVEMVFLVFTIYFLVKGIKAKNYQQLKKFGLMYLVFNFTRQYLAYSTSVEDGTIEGKAAVFTYIIGIAVVIGIVAVLIKMKNKK